MKASISTWERRDVRAAAHRSLAGARRWRIVSILLQILFYAVVFVMAWHVFVPVPIPLLSNAEPEPTVLVNGRGQSLSSFCAQARSDHLMAGTAMSDTLKDVCKFDK